MDRDELADKIGFLRGKATKEDDREWAEVKARSILRRNRRLLETDERGYENGNNNIK